MERSEARVGLRRRSKFGQCAIFDRKDGIKFGDKICFGQNEGFFFTEKNRRPNDVWEALRDHRGEKKMQNVKN